VDAFARRPAAGPQSFAGNFRFGVPPAVDLEFFGNAEAARCFAAATARIKRAGGSRVEIGLAPFLEAGELLYEGPWVAERLDATAALLAEDPQALLPVTRAIVESGRQCSALDAHRAYYRLMALRRRVEVVFATIDCLVLPTVGTVYETAAVLAEPLRLNGNLGRYTSFANLLDLAVLALPAEVRATVPPFGISLCAPAGSDLALLDLGTRLQAGIRQPLPNCCAMHIN
jgi:allophanate hydrolase